MFLKLTQKANNKPILVNPDHVATIAPDLDGGPGTDIMTIIGGLLEVSEPFEEVAERLTLRHAIR